MSLKLSLQIKGNYSKGKLKMPKLHRTELENDRIQKKGSKSLLTGGTTESEQHPERVKSDMIL